jgi:hypothetical protein
MASNEYIPYLLSRLDIYRNRKHKVVAGSRGADLREALDSPADFVPLPNNLRFCQLFKGRDSDNSRPLNTCLHLYKQSRLGRPTVFSTDINSVYRFAQSLAFYT